MDNRSRKREELTDQLPVDKRVCSESTPGSSNSPLQATHSEPPDCEMEATSVEATSSASISEAERDSASVSCDSDEIDDHEERHRIFRDYYRRRTSLDQGKIQRISASLKEDAELGSQLAALTELCDVLSFSSEELSSSSSDMLAPVLVALAKHESSPDIMLLSIRCITYLCDALPRSSALLVRHDVVPALCARLMAIEYLDVAEQCLQALEKISRDHPIVCLDAGVIMAALNYIDFFCTSIQRVAVSIVVNLSKRLPSDRTSPFMEAVPILCNLLQYEDQKLVENVAICLIKIVDRVKHSSEMLDELCKHGLIHQATHLIALNARSSLSHSVYTGLIGLLCTLASGSVASVRTLLESNISSTLKHILSSYDLTQSMPIIVVGGEQCNQVHEFLKLLNELLPPLSRNCEDVLEISDKEKILGDQPELLQQFGADILPVLIQVVSSGVNLCVCYCCLSIINKLVYFSKPDMLLEFLRNTNLSSFLASAFTRKDQHVLLVVLEIVENIMKKLPDVFLNSFIKEGVVYAVDVLLVPENCSELTFPVSNQKSAVKDARRCLCYAFDIHRSPSSSGRGTCKLAENCVHTLAKRIKDTYFSKELLNSGIGLTETLQDLRSLCVLLKEKVLSSENDSDVPQEEYLSRILGQIMTILTAGEYMSTFEFMESGIVKSLATYLSNGRCTKGNNGNSNDSTVILSRLEIFARIALSSRGQNWESMPIAILVKKLQSALTSMEGFPVISSHVSKARNTYATVPFGRPTSIPCLKVHFVKEEGEIGLCDYASEVVTVEPSSTWNDIEKFLLPKVTVKADLHHCDVDSSPKADDLADAAMAEYTLSSDDGKGGASTPCTKGGALSKLIFHLKGKQIDHGSTLYQSILQQKMKEEHDVVVGPGFWNEVYQVTYGKAEEQESTTQEWLSRSQVSSACDNQALFWKSIPFLYTTLVSELFCGVEKSDPIYEILVLLKILEGVNKFASHLMYHEQKRAFSEGGKQDLQDLIVIAPTIPTSEFVNIKLTDKLEQQMRDPLAVSTGGMPSWCSQLMTTCPYLFSFETKCKYLRQVMFNSLQPQSLPQFVNNNTVSPTHRNSHTSTMRRKKFQVCRSNILDSAAKLMDQHAHQKAIVEVEYDEEVGTGLGPTLEFYTLVSHEFQKIGLGMWRGDHNSFTSEKESMAEEPGLLSAPLGFFPRPLSHASSTLSELQLEEVMKKFVLLGQIVAKALQDARVFDLLFSKAFYKLIVEQELNIYDIQSIDPELGRTLLEFQALIERKKVAHTVGGMPLVFDSCFRNTRIEDLWLDFTLPGYPDYILSSENEHKMVNFINLEEYVSSIVDATVNSGISRQVEAFKSGFNQVLPIKCLQIFTEGEIERLLCGEQEAWTPIELLEHIKFDHGYTASSPPVIYLLEIIQDFEYDHKRAFLQFVTGAPRLPPGGLAALNPQLTVVRKHCGEGADGDLPSVMTCANYLKLPPYSSKERMRERLLFAITEGQGSFHLS